MRKNMKKIILSLLFVFTFAFTLTSCNNSSTITFPNTEDTTTTIVDATPSTTGIIPVNPTDTTVNSNVNDTTSTSTVTSGNTNNDTASYVSLNYVLVEDNLNSEKEKALVDAVDDVVEACVSVTCISSSATSRGAGVLFAYDDNLGLSFIVTCFHVIEGFSNFSITLDDGTEEKAYLVGGYSDEDIAVLAIKKTGLKYVPILSDSSTLKRGSDVFCIGNPLGTLPNSVARGVISYVDRVIETNSYTSRTLLQTDVAINSGNSGGGLFNTEGLLIGIVSNKYSSSSIENLGFAVPSKIVLSTIKSILNTAKYNTSSNSFYEGYIEGDYEYGFAISLGQQSRGFWNYTYVIYISSVESNTYYTGVGYLEYGDILNSVKIDYQDKDTITYNITNITSSTTTEIMQLLTNTGVKIGDKITFNVTRNNNTIDVEFEVIQFRYSI